MERKVIPLVALTGALVMLAGCVEPQPRYSNSNQGGYYDRGGYDQSARNVCSNCGEVEDVQRIYVRDRTTGLGAVIGAIAGGVLGNTVGGGRGRQATTVAGAVPADLPATRSRRTIRVASRRGNSTCVWMTVAAPRLPSSTTRGSSAVIVS